MEAAAESVGYPVEERHLLDISCLTTLHAPTVYHQGKLSCFIFIFTFDFFNTEWSRISTERDGNMHTSQSNSCRKSFIIFCRSAEILLNQELLCSSCARK